MRSCIKVIAGLIIVALLCWIVPSILKGRNGHDQTGERVLFNDEWLFKRNDPASFSVENAAGETVLSRLDYQVAKEWLCASGNQFIEKNDSVSVSDMPSKKPGRDIEYTDPGYDDNDWRQLRLPHDWGIEGDFNIDLPGNTGKLPFAGSGWYRKHFYLPSSDTGKQIYLDIDGAMAFPMVWLNGGYVGGWAYGYSSFRLDLTKYIKTDEENVLAIRLFNPENSSRWYPGSGIYRNVWLVKSNPVHIAQWGTYITTPTVTDQEAGIVLNVTVENQSEISSDIGVSVEIRELSPGKALRKKKIITASSDIKNINSCEKGHYRINVRIRKPRLWSPDSPNLYVAVTTVKVDGKKVDSYETAFGIRTVRLDSEKGLILNGKHIVIKGVCNHHDLGALGTAFNMRAAERQLEILKEMGVNALRTAHNMPAPELLDLCDRMGIMVMDEAFDCWEKGKTENDYGVLFTCWHEKDLRAMIRRDRNHPGIIMWSIGNEVRELGSPRGAEIAAELTGMVKEEDATRPVIIGSNNPDAGFNGLQNTVDVYGQNYYTWVYEKFHTENPHIPVLGSETSSCVSSRGEYFFPVTYVRKEGKGRFQMSSYDLYAPAWGCTPDAQFKALDNAGFVSGEFVWTGFDYMGEPTPFNEDITNMLNFTDEQEKKKMRKELDSLGSIRSPSRSSYFGIVDLCGFKKDRYYLYQSRWRPDLPVVHILPHWNWPQRIGEITPVHIYTSGNEAELFLNDVSLGRKTMKDGEYRLTWDSVVYKPGSLKAVAYKYGKKWAEQTVTTTGDPEKILLRADRPVLKADGYDLSFITVVIADNDNRQVPDADNSLSFSITGPGKIVATDNGDATSLVSFQTKQRKAFNGLALVIIQSLPGETGTITLKAASGSLASAEMSIRSTL